MVRKNRAVVKNIPSVVMSPDVPMMDTHPPRACWRKRMVSGLANKKKTRAL